MCKCGRFGPIVLVYKCLLDILGLESGFSKYHALLNLNFHMLFQKQDKYLEGCAYCCSLVHILYVERNT